MDCFIPLMEQFYAKYGFYPQYPVADAGYGSYNNYIYCQQHGMEKYMKFPMFEKETKDKKYHEDPFRAVNFQIDDHGDLRCPNGKKFIFSYRKAIQGALLRINRSIQAEGTFGIMKYDRWYKRLVRKGMKSVRMEIFLVSIGHNLYKCYNKQMRKLPQTA